MAVDGDLSFEERPGQYLVEVRHSNVLEDFSECRIGTVQKSPVLMKSGIEISVTELTASWRGTLDW